MKDQAQREKRHRAVLRALRDTLVSPDGAQVATMLPHLTRLSGAIAVRTEVGRAPLYSALESDFVTHLQAMADQTCQVYPFETIDAFYRLMNTFIATSVPALHPFWKTSQLSKDTQEQRDDTGATATNNGAAVLLERRSRNGKDEVDRTNWG